MFRSYSPQGKKLAFRSSLFENSCIVWRSISKKSLSKSLPATSYTLSKGICRSHTDSITGGECNLMWIFFTSQSTLILAP
jgi:hypothetical protein